MRVADSRHPREEACDVTVSVPSVSAVEAKESSLAIVDHRDARMFPMLVPEEIDRIRRFGEVRHYAADAALFVTGLMDYV